MVNFNNHNLKFTYTQSVGVERQIVYANGQQIGLIRKVLGGWVSFDDQGNEGTFRTGPRKYIAEYIAFKAGLLDGNYNAIENTLRQKLLGSGDEHIIDMTNQLDDAQLQRLKELVNEAE